VNADCIEGAARNMGGKVEEGIGKVTGDVKGQVEGKMTQAAGVAQDLYGDSSMTEHRSPRLPSIPEPHRRGDRVTLSVAEMKARQTSKLRQLADALIAAEFRTLDEQAKVLGLSRSTTWTILNANHKGSGLSVAITNRILAAPRLPQPVRSVLVEYAGEKAAGLYGGSMAQRRQFAARLSINVVRTAISA
jgi:uncharacterized protein YjbJ (UPF0337 family)